MNQKQLLKDYVKFIKLISEKSNEIEIKELCQDKSRDIVLYYDSFISEEKKVE